MGGRTRASSSPRTSQSRGMRGKCWRALEVSGGDACEWLRLKQRARRMPPGDHVAARAAGLLRKLSHVCAGCGTLSAIYLGRARQRMLACAWYNGWYKARVELCHSISRIRSTLHIRHINVQETTGTSTSDKARMSILLCRVNSCPIPAGVRT